MNRNSICSIIIFFNWVFMLHSKTCLSSLVRHVQACGEITLNDPRAHSPRPSECSPYARALHRFSTLQPDLHACFPVLPRCCPSFTQVQEQGRQNRVPGMMVERLFGSVAYFAYSAYLNKDVSWLFIFLCRSYAVLGKVNRCYAVLR